MPDKKPLKLSVVIPCLNEQDYVGDLLEDLAAQQNAPEFEVIVSDAHSIDKTVEVAESFTKTLPLKVVEAPRGVARGRNAGADKAQGEWLLYLDADVRLPTDYLAKFIAGAERQHLDIASSLYRANSPHLIDKIGAQFFMAAALALQNTKYLLVGGFCILIKRSLHEKIHGFNSKLRQSEDHDYATRAVLAGGKFGHVRSTAMRISIRRFATHGRWRMFAKYLRVFFYRITHHGGVDPNETYDFGHHPPPEAGTD